MESFEMVNDFVAFTTKPVKENISNSIVILIYTFQKSWGEWKFERGEWIYNKILVLHYNKEFDRMKINRKRILSMSLVVLLCLSALIAISPASSAESKNDNSKIKIESVTWDKANQGFIELNSPFCSIKTTFSHYSRCWIDKRIWTYRE